MERKVIVISGPTASGKTHLSLLLASKLNSEIISADSRQIYRYLDIGTAKPSKDELNSVKHHFIDSLNPDENFNAGLFERESLEIIKNLHSQNKIPVITGGTGLYIKSLIDGIIDEVDTDLNYREELKALMLKSGQEGLYQELKKIDPESAKTMLPQNWKRVMRALEVFKVSGKPILQHHKEQHRSIDIDFYQYGLNWERVQLYKNIDSRVNKMIDSGLIDEVKSILNNNYSKEINSLNTVGYKEIISFLENDISLERAVELIKRNSRRYAKRQMTWFRKDSRIKWFDVGSIKDLDNISDIIYNEIQSYK